LRKQEEESSGQKEMYDGKIKELEVQVQDKEAALKRQEEESARQNEDYDGRVQELESQVQEKEDALTKLKENYAGTEDDMQAEISRLNQKNKELEAEKKAMGEEFEEPEISSNALLLKADMQYMLANDYMNENATDTAKIYLAAAMTLCKQALDRSDEEEKGLIQEKINGYQDTLKMLEEQ
jgi:peptidoglycan hydrolase CwlO-like protein